MNFKFIVTIEVDNNIGKLNRNVHGSLEHATSLDEVKVKYL